MRSLFFVFCLSTFLMACASVSSQPNRHDAAKTIGKSTATGKVYDDAVRSVSDHFRRLKECARVDSIEHWVGIRSASTDEVWTVTGCGLTQAFDLIFVPLGNTGETHFISTPRVQPKPTIPSSTVAQDVYTTIDTSNSQKAIRALASTDSAIRDAAIRGVRQYPERYAPPVFYEMATTLHRAGDSRGALFWLHAGRLRAYYDSLRCAEQQRARKATSALEFSVPSDMALTLKASKGQLPDIVQEVLDWDARTPYEYDHRWINLHARSSTVDAITVSRHQANAFSEP